MARVCKAHGKLAVIEFTDVGFDAIGKAHKQIHGGEHRRGSIAEKQIDEFLRANFADVRHSDLGLNNVWVAIGKRWKQSETNKK